MSNTLPNEPPQPIPPQVGFKAQQGGVMLIVTYPFMMTQLIIPEETIDTFVQALLKEKAKIPRVILG